MLLSFQGITQVSSNAITSRETELKKVLPSLESFCALPLSGWENTGAQNFQPNLEKLTVVHIGSVHRTADFENMRNLSVLQQNYPQIRILLIASNSGPQFADRDALEDFLFRHDVHLPIFRDTIPDDSECLSPESEAKTVLLTPDRRILDIRRGFIDVEKLGNDIFQLQGLLLDVYKSDKTPYFNNSARRFEKELYWPSLAGVEAMNSLNLLGFTDYMRNQMYLSTMSGEIVERIGSGRSGFADGDFQNARFNGPRGIAFHSDSSAVYIADSRNHRIRKINPETMEVTTVLGNGTYDEIPTAKVIGIHGSICLPTSLHMDGDLLYLATAQGIYRMDVRTGVAELLVVANNLSGLTTDENGILYCSSTTESKIYEIYEGDTIPVAGSTPGFGDGKKQEILFSGPAGIEIQGREMLIADTYNHALRTLQFRRGKSETLIRASKESAINIGLKQPMDLTTSGNLTYITSGGNGTIWTYDELTQAENALTLSMGNQTLPPIETKIGDLREGETIQIHQGKNKIHFYFQLDSTLSISESFPSAANISPSQYIEVIDSDLSDMEVILSYQAEEDKKPGPIVLDLYLTVQNELIPEIKYQWNISFMYNIELASEATDDEKKEISITTPVKDRE